MIKYSNRTFMRKALVGIVLIITLFAAAHIPNFFAIETDQVVSPTFEPTGPPVALNVSETVRPGETFNIVAGNLPNTQAQVGVVLTYINRSGNLGRKEVLKISSYSQNLIQVKAPEDFPFGVWQVEVTTTLGSTRAFINRPRALTSDDGEIVSGQTLRVWGRNLAFTEWIRELGPTVSLSNGKHTLATKVLASSRYSLTLELQGTLQVGTTYTLKLANGYGGTIGEATSDFGLSAISKGNDHIGLGVAWGHKLTFTANVYDVTSDNRLALKAARDGTTDDTAAIQAAVDLASAQGGGVVYLPAGRYLIDSGITLRPKTVLRGDGISHTSVEYNKTYSYWGGFVTFAPNASQSGVTEMKVTNLNTGSNTNGTIGAGGTNSEIFIKNIDLTMASGRPVALGEVDRLVVTGSTVRDESLTVSPFVAGKAKWVIFRGNTIEYRCCRTHLTYVKNGVVENNTFSLDSHYALTGEEKGALEVSYSENLVVAANTVRTTGDKFLGHVNEQEMILTQGGGDHTAHAFSFGTSTATTANTLSNSQGGFNSIGPFTPYTMIAITSGNGAGQWRYIINHDNSSVTVDRPWDVTPLAGSKYVVKTWSAYRLHILGNTFRDVKQAVDLYSGGWDNLVANNTLVDGGYLSFGGRDVSPSGGNGDRPFTEVLWKTNVTGNIVSNPKKRRRSFIDFFAHQFDIANGPLTVFNNEARDNKVIAAKPDKNGSLYDFNPLHDLHVTEGFSAFLDWRHEAKITSSTPTVVGTIFQNNTSENFDSTNPYTIGDRSVRQTVVETDKLPTFGLPDSTIESEKNEFTDNQTKKSSSGSSRGGSGPGVPSPTDQTIAETNPSAKLDESMPNKSAETAPSNETVAIYIVSILSAVSSIGYARWLLHR